MRASIIIENKILHKIDSKIYGHFIEELGESIHDGIWAYSEKIKKLPMIGIPNLELVRKDVYEAIGRITSPISTEKTVLRWPGGCFSDTYHWKDGIGFKSERPLRKNAHWSKGFINKLMRSKHGIPGPDYNNHFGTVEFLTLCEELGVEPYIAVNYGTGTPEEAADWVEFCNGPKESHWGAKRALVHPEPFKVKYWGIANEIWGKPEPGYEEKPEDYGKRYLEFAQQMKARDPDIKLIAVGIDKNEPTIMLSPNVPTWNRRLLKVIDGNVDYLAIHQYIRNPKGIGYLLSDNLKFIRNRKIFEALMAASGVFRDIILRNWEDITTALGPGTGVRIAFDEWNLWYKMPQVVKTNWCLMDGLCIASILHVFQEFSPLCPIANLAQLINAIGLIRTDDAGVVKTGSYLAFELFWNHTFPNYLQSNIETPSFTNKRWGNIPSAKTGYLDGRATISDDRKELTITAINKSLDQSIEMRLNFQDFDLSPTLERVYRLAHENPWIYNTPEERTNLKVVEIDPSSLSEDCIILPPHSLTIMRFKVQ